MRPEVAPGWPDLTAVGTPASAGPEVATTVAHRLVLPQCRLGGQSQHAELLKVTPRSDRIQLALENARTHLKQPLSVETLAEVARLSPRQFSRVFTAETGSFAALEKLVAAKHIVRKGHGSFEIADPFVRQVWLRHAQMRQSLRGEAAGPGPEALPD